MSDLAGPAASGTAGGAGARSDGATFARYVPEFSEERLLDAFAVHGASALLLVGSRVTGSDQPGSDVDFLAIYDDPADVPASIPLEGAVSMGHSLGENWIGDVDGQETNVEAVTAGTIRRVARLLADPLDTHRAPILQPLEIRLLDRLRRCVPVRGAGYVRALDVDAALARLPMVGVVMRHCGVTSNVPVMRTRLQEGDRPGLLLLVSMMSGGLGMATMSLYGNMDTAWRKVVPALRALERRHGPLPVTAGDLETMLAPASDGAALEAVLAALGRVRGAVAARAGNDPLWAEALRGLDAQQ